MKTRSKIAAVGLSMLILTAPIIGPFTYFPTIWPYLSPILSRPEAIPSDAVASYHWKANGTHWSWLDDLPSGCALWSGGGEADDYISLRLASDSSGCEGASPQFTFFQAGSPEVSFSRAGESAHSYSPSSAGLTPEEREEVVKLTGEAMQVEQTPGEARVLSYIQDWLDKPGQ